MKKPKIPIGLDLLLLLGSGRLEEKKGRVIAREPHKLDLLLLLECRKKEEEEEIGRGKAREPLSTWSAPIMQI